MIFLLCVLISCIALDQITKAIARNALSETNTLSYIGDIFRLQLGYNAGATLNLGALLPEAIRTLIFTVGAGTAMGALFIYLLASKSVDRITFAALTFVLAGGIGNLADRVFNEGLVTDFMNIGIGSIRSGVFNVADMAITGGGVFLLIHALWQRRPAQRN